MIYLLRSKKEVGYDSFSSFLIEANSEEDARKIAQDNGGDEISYWYPGYTKHETIPYWTSDEFSTCQELSSTDFKPGEIIMSSYHAG